MKKEILKEAFEKNIKGTRYKAMVPEQKIFLCHLTNAVCVGVGISKEVGKVYMTSRSLKHLFDRKPAEEFLFIIDNLHKIVKYPDKIYKNKKEKRGEYCFVKKIDNSEYLCSIEIVKNLPIEDNLISEEIQIVTVFRLRDENYIKKYTFLWSWGDDDSHRSALDTLKGTTHAPQ